MSNVNPLDTGSAGALGELAELLARISHDLRTPLNAVIGFSDAMQNELFGPLGHARYQEYARHIRQSGDELLKAAEETLAMTSLLASPRRAEQLDDIALDRLVAVALASRAEQISDIGCRVELSVEDGIEVRGDPRLMPRALVHLIAAALAQATSNSDISIRASAHYGRVALSVVVKTPSEYSAPRQPNAPLSERGLGRDDMPVWLARGLLELQGYKLARVSGPDSFRLETDLEQAAQRDFFARRA